MGSRTKANIKNPNHPPKGAAIRVDPIRSLEKIELIKQQLAEKPRDLCLFVLGINTGLRANELLGLTVGQVARVRAGGRIALKQSKTRKYRSIYLNKAAVRAVQVCLKYHADPCGVAPLFPSRKRERVGFGLKPLTVSTMTSMVKDWCTMAELRGNFGSHSLRKTWGYHQRISNKTSVALLMRAFGHKSESQTLTYLGIEDNEIRKLYELEL